MSRLPVFADALSRLHADVAIVRLVQAGISESRISAVFSQRRAPNSVSCWLKSFHAIPRTRAWPVAAAGILGRILRRGFGGEAVEREFENLGLNGSSAKWLQEKVEDGRIVLCVHARTESEALAAWQVFRRAGLENVTRPMGGTPRLAFQTAPTALPAGVAA
jgi:hypothetical protein